MTCLVLLPGIVLLPSLESSSVRLVLFEVVEVLCVVIFSVLAKGILALHILRFGPQPYRRMIGAHPRLLSLASLEL